MYKRKTWKVAVNKSQMTTIFLTKRTQCLYYSLEIGNIKFKLVGFFSFNSKETTEGELREMMSCPHCAERPVDYPNGYVYWKLDSWFTLRQEDTYLGAIEYRWNLKSGI